jgi:NADH-quinone oxidoreductase subunit D
LVGSPEELDPSAALDVLDATRAELLDDKYVLRLTESEAEEHSGLTEDQNMIMNLGPQHPSTHGVLRVVLEIDGERSPAPSPVIGYLHTGMEKTGEQLTYLQGPTNVTRMDYAAPLFNELVFSLATEQLLGIEVPERAQWIRTLHVRGQPAQLAPAVPGHQRHGPGRRRDDDLRLARA